MDKLRTYDATKITFVGEFAEHGGGGPSHGISEIDGIAEVDDKGQTIDDDEYPLADQCVGGILLSMPGEEHHRDIGDIGDKDGRGVEYQTASQHLHEVGIS